MSRIGLVALVLASAIVGGAASSYVASAVAQTQPAAPPVVAPVSTPRFEHWCATLDRAGLKLAGDRGWEMVTAYNDLARATIHIVGTTGYSKSATVPDLPTTYCFKRPVR